MKRIFFLIAAVAITTTGITSCNNGHEQDHTDADTISAQTTMPAATPEHHDTTAVPPVDPSMDSNSMNKVPDKNPMPK